MIDSSGILIACPQCGEPMSNLPSLNARQCATGCKSVFDWKLSDGQKPLIGSNRQDRKEQLA